MYHKRVVGSLVLAILSITLIIITAERTLNAQEEDDPIYLPLIYKNFDPARPYHYLSLHKTGWPSPVQAGDVLTYTIRYHVGGAEPAPGLTLIDTLPHSTTFESCSGGQTCTESAGRVTWNLGDVSPPTTGLVTLTVRPDPSIISGTLLYNTATLTDTAGLTRTTTISTPVQTSHALEVDKTAWPSPVQAGSLVTYTIRYTVTGNEPVPGLTLVDTLPHSTTFEGCLGGQTCIESAGHVTWNLGDVPSPTTGLVTLTVRPDPSIISGTVLYNTATLSDTTGLTRTTTISTAVYEPKRDIALIFDISGSMQYDTVCHGCYEQFGDGDPQRPELPWQNLNYGYAYPIYNTIADYPHTFIYPLPTEHLPDNAFDGTNNGGIGQNEPGEASGGLCYGLLNYGNDVDYVTLVGGGPTQYFIVIEAELYTRSNHSSYETAFRRPGTGYWAVQHATYRTVDRMFSTSPDGLQYQTGATSILPGEYDRGSWMSHHPFMRITREQIGEPGEPGYLPEVPLGHDYTLNDARANISPSLDYEFIVKADEGDGGWDGRDDSEGTHIYARLQGGDVYWAVYAAADGGPGVDPYDPPPLGTGTIERDTESYAGDPQYGGAQASQWRWIELTGDNDTELNLESGQKYTLRIWAGQAGLDIDQIVIANTTDRTLIFDAGYDNGATYPDNPRLHATAGSAFGQACNRCNPIYGQVIEDPADCLPPVDNGASQVSSRYYDDAAGHYDLRKDEIFGGYQPLRGAKEAVKRYVAGLDPALDQAGLVGFSTVTTANQTLDLRCLQSDPGGCYGGSTPVTHTAVLNLLEKYPARGSTNMAQAMRDGLYLLGVPADGPTRPETLPALPANCSGISCARGPAVQRVMILMTDGVNNSSLPDTGCGDDPTLFTPDLPTDTGTPVDYINERFNRGRDCTMYYAHIAAANNVTLYTISLGYGADMELLQAAAEVTAHLGGQYFAAVSPEDLDAIFEVIR